MTHQSVEHDDQPLRELLQICEEFFGQASPATRDELDAFLPARQQRWPELAHRHARLHPLRMQHHHHNSKSPTPETTSDPAITIH